MHTILGAGGTIGLMLARELAMSGQKVRLVGRNPVRQGASEVFRADLSDRERTIEAVSGSEVVYLLAGLKYDVHTWQLLWPRIMENSIEACKRANAKLLFFDNVYMYGKVSGWMTEETPYNPCSKKGEIRARIASSLLDEIRAGNLKGMIARCADFYGPLAKKGIPNILVFDRLARRKPALWLLNDALPHSCTYTEDAARSLALLAATDAAWSQTWHVPTSSNPPNGKAFIEMAAKAFGLPPKYHVLSRTMLKVSGWFDSDIRESREMLYQSDSDYLFDSSKFSNAFDFTPTSYQEGILRTALSFASARS